MKIKKNLFGSVLSILSILSLVSCDKISQQADNYKNYRLDGMWQLKTVKDSNGNETRVDTVFYSFQREVIFSFTVTEDNSKSAIPPRYGYVDMPSGNQVHVLMANCYNPDFAGYIETFLSLSGWSSADITFDIKTSDKTNLVLFDKETGKTYTLKKF